MSVCQHTFTTLSSFSCFFETALSSVSWLVLKSRWLVNFSFQSLPPWNTGIIDKLYFIWHRTWEQIRIDQGLRWLSIVHQSDSQTECPLDPVETNWHPRLSSHILLLHLPSSCVSLIFFFMSFSSQVSQARSWLTLGYSYILHWVSPLSSTMALKFCEKKKKKRTFSIHHKWYPMQSQKSFLSGFYLFWNTIPCG